MKMLCDRMAWRNCNEVIHGREDMVCTRGETLFCGSDIHRTQEDFHGCKNNSLKGMGGMHPDSGGDKG